MIAKHDIDPDALLRKHTIIIISRINKDLKFVMETNIHEETDLALKRYM